ncbi:hypothetical protein [Actinomadura madurae]|uniref:hypothetical protein n=1 Tax=Actinomadura madurae TaxID=1993 RepID=UPI003999715A
MTRPAPVSSGSPPNSPTLANQLERPEVTHLLELAGTAGPPLPPAYRDILAVLADHPDGLRPEDIACALNLPATSKNTVEGIRTSTSRMAPRTRWGSTYRPSSSRSIGPT